MQKDVTISVTVPDGSKFGGRATKKSIIRKLLYRPKGASLTEMMTATGWKPHSVRSFLSGLRKGGDELLRECRVSGDTCWRIAR